MSPRNGEPQRYSWEMQKKKKKKNMPATDKVCLMELVQTTVHVATLSLKLQIKLSVSVLSDQAIFDQTLTTRQSDRISSSVPVVCFFKSLASVI